MKKSIQRAVLAAAAMLAGTGVMAVDRPHAKDIVLDSVTQAATPAAQAPTAETMSVSVLLESPDGSLTPRGTDKAFRTGDRFRVKVLGARSGRLSLYNTNPKGETLAKPIWQGELKVGQETISPRMQLTGNTGVDQLHVVLEPSTPDQGDVYAWLNNWLQSFKPGAASKDIRLDVFDTASHTYVAAPQVGQGLVLTIQIAHDKR
jgi:hypothetical protein